MAPLLQIEDLHTDIRLRDATMHALDGVDLTLEAGECLGLVGESGCGKTMTALSIMRLLPPGGLITGGRIMLDGQEISSLDDDGMRQVRGNEVGMVFGDPAWLDPATTVGDQIAETVRLHRGADSRAARARAIEVLGRVGLPRPAERIGNYPHELSGGMGQRVMIAMAVACEPKLLIADEPATALDRTVQIQILELIDDLRLAPGHGGDPGRARPGCDRRARRPGRGHVRGPGNGDHVHRAAAGQPPPPLHRGVARRAAGRRRGGHPRPACRIRPPRPRPAGSRPGAGTCAAPAPTPSRSSRATAGITCTGASSRGPGG